MMHALTLNDHYGLARRLAFGRRDALLLHGPVRPTWSSDGRFFWYSTNDAEGIRHVLVDISNRKVSNLFDAQQLAAALTLQSGLAATAASLSLTDIQHDIAAATMKFGFGGSRWCWQNASGPLVRLGECFADYESPSPDGTAAVLLDGPNLMLRETGKSEKRALTTDGQFEWGYGDYNEGWSQISSRLPGIPLKPTVMWSPDAQRIAVMRCDQRSVPLNHLVQSAPPGGVRPALHSYRYPMPADTQSVKLELWIIGRDGGKVRAQLDGLESRCFHPFRLNNARWSRDGRYFDLIDISRDARRWTLWRVDSITGTATRLAEEEGPAVMLPSATLADHPLWSVLSDGTVLAWSQRSGWGHLYIHSPASGWQALTEGPWLVRSILRVDESKRQVTFTASGRERGINPYYCLAYRVDFDGSNLTLLTPEKAHHEYVHPVPPTTYLDGGHQSFAPDGMSFVDVSLTTGMPHRSVLRDSTTGDVLMDLQTSDPNGGWPDELPLREPFTVEALRAETFPDCSDLWGVLHKPAGFDPKNKYPVIEVIYGGPQTPITGTGWSPAFYFFGYEEQLAALGFVVVTIDGPGTPYRSRAFQLDSYGRLESCSSLPDHVNAIRHLASSRPWMDLERVGITGASGGGYATVRALASYPDFYKVGVAMCGNHDNAAFIGSWGDIYQGLYTEAGYAAQANTSVAASIRGDLLLIHGEMDDNVHPGMTLRVVDALIQADRNFDLLIVPNAGHAVFASTYVQRRTFDYFVERLAGLEAPPPSDRTPDDSRP